MRGEAEADCGEAECTGSGKSLLESASSNQRSGRECECDQGVFFFFCDRFTAVSWPANQTGGGQWRETNSKRSPPPPPVMLCGGSHVSQFHPRVGLLSVEELCSVSVSWLGVVDKTFCSPVSRLHPSPGKRSKREKKHLIETHFVHY